jgi:hypothetical protein
MPSGNGTAPFDASADGTATPVGTPSASAAQPSSGLSPLQSAGFSGCGHPAGTGPDAPRGSILLLIFSADAARATPYAKLEMLQCGVTPRAGYS